MRSFVLVLAATLAPLFFVHTALSQTAGAQQMPDPLTAYNQAIQARDWPAAVAAAQRLVNQSPTSVNLKFLAQAQLGSRSADKALATFQQAIAAARAEQPAENSGASAISKWKDGLSVLYLGEGNALLLLKRTPEAISAYTTAANYASNPSLVFFNICAVQYNSGDTTGPLDTCRKSVQADPTRANAWFILGSVLFANSPINSKGNVIASADTKQALNQYLVLAPNGPHAADTKAMIAMIAK